MAKSGIPVPATIPEGSKAFIICVPDDPFFYGVVAGAIKTTMFRYYWSGTEEEIDAVQARMSRMYHEYQEQDGCMICEQIIECINSDPGTREALVNWFVAEASTNEFIIQAINAAYNPLQEGKDMPASVTAGALTGSNPTCNLDKLWGWIDGGIEAMNANNVDAFQITEEQSNVFERIATVTAAIPGIGVLPVDEAIQFVQGLFTDDLFEAYEANDTSEYRRVLKCDIFCLAQDNGCKVSMDLLIAYFQERLTYTGEDTLEDIVNFLVLGIWTGTQVNDAFYLIQLLWLKYGNRFFKILGLMGVATMFQLGDPSNDWELLCEVCPSEYSHEDDFAIDEQGWETGTRDGGGPFNAHYAPGDGWLKAASESGSSVDIEFEIFKYVPSPGNFQHVEVDYELTAAGDSQNGLSLSAATAPDNPAPNTIVFNDNAALMAGTHTFVWDGDVDVSAAGLRLSALVYSVPSGTDTLTIKAIRFSGNANPFV